MGVDERIDSLREIESSMFSILEAEAMIETPGEAMVVYRILEKIAPYVQLREEGYRVILNALLEGDFIVESDGRFVGTVPRLVGNSIFIPMYSIKAAKGHPIVEEATDRHGYIIRRKTS
jgi:isocitrate dehydrogenase